MRACTAECTAQRASTDAPSVEGHTLTPVALAACGTLLPAIEGRFIRPRVLKERLKSRPALAQRTESCLGEWSKPKGLPDTLTCMTGLYCPNTWKRAQSQAHTRLLSGPPWARSMARLARACRARCSQHLPLWPCLRTGRVSGRPPQQCGVSSPWLRPARSSFSASGASMRWR